MEKFGEKIGNRTGHTMDEMGQEQKKILALKNIKMILSKLISKVSKWHQIHGKIFEVKKMGKILGRGDTLKRTFRAFATRAKNFI